MSYKDILVYADTSKHAAERLDTAARLAVAHGAHLTALHVSSIPPLPAEMMGAGVADTVRQWQKTTQTEKRDQARALVEAAGKRHGIAIEWRQAEGAADDVILLQSAYADLVVISQAGNPMDLEQPIGPSLGVLALSSGRPLLIVPNRPGEFPVGKHVMVAWKACAEAARAVHDALPLLEAAKAVTLLEVTTKGTDKKRLVGAEMASHLARHSVKVVVESVKETSLNDGPLILSRAVESGADLIVMGGYGHSRLREVVLGGVTNHILKNQHVPVFMAH